MAAPYVNGPGGNPTSSAAYQAGIAHGASLAAQHASKAAPAKTTPTKAPAAPTRKPATAPANSLLAQASQIANQQTAAQIAAIRAQQDMYAKQGGDRAAQINEAAQAAAQLLKDWNLPGATADSYNQAALNIGELAKGFSGQTATDATNAADQVRANLAALGAPADGLKTSTGQTSQPAALGNVLYGVGGFIPGNLLETAGQAQAAVQRSQPASLLSYGQQQAAGAVAAGQQQADTLTPQILAAQGKLPDLARSVLSSLLSEQNQAFNQRFKVGQANERIDEFNARQTLAKSKQADLNAYRQATYGVSVQRLNLDAKKFAQTTVNQDRSYTLALGRLGVAKKSLQLRLTAQEYKLQNGGFTKLQVNKFSTDAEFVASQASSAQTAPSLAQAMQEMYKRHVPLSIAQDALRKTGLYTIPTGAQVKAYNQTTGLAASFAAPTGKVTISPSANRAGVPLNPVIPTLVSSIAGVYGKPLTIGTGTNHNEYVVNSHRVSDHWAGNAADIPASGAALTKLGQAALVAMGADPKWALKQTGGLFNLDTPLGRVQIIFNSMTGGNHYTHLHVGLSS